MNHTSLVNTLKKVLRQREYAGQGECLGDDKECWAMPKAEDGKTSALKISHAGADYDIHADCHCCALYKFIDRIEHGEDPANAPGPKRGILLGLSKAKGAAGEPLEKLNIYRKK